MFNLKKTKKAISYLSILVLILILTGCSRQQNRQIIKNLNNRKADFSETKNNIGIEIKKLSSNELGAIFHLAPKEKRENLFKENKFNQFNFYEVKISNNSEHTAFLKLDNFIKKQQKILKRNLKHTYKKSLSVARDARTASGIALAMVAGSATYIFGGIIKTIHATEHAGAGWMLIFTAITAIPALILTTVTQATIKGLKYKRKRLNKKIDKLVEQHVLNFKQSISIKKNESLQKIFLLYRDNLEQNQSVELYSEKNDLKWKFTFTIK